MSTLTMTKLLMNKIAIKKQTNIVHGFLVDSSQGTVEFIDSDTNRFGPFALDVVIQFDEYANSFSLRDDCGVQHECWIPSIEGLY